MRNKQGFTLVEILIVVAVILILVGIILPNFTYYVEKSRQRTDLTNMRAAAAAATEYWLHNNYEHDATYYFVGNHIELTPPSSGYGVSTMDVSNFNQGFAYTSYGTPCSDGKANYIIITVTANHEITLIWSSENTP